MNERYEMGFSLIWILWDDFGVRFVGFSGLRRTGMISFVFCREFRGSGNFLFGENFLGPVHFSFL